MRKWKKTLRRGTGTFLQNQQGITGLETAIVLIAFVVVAAVFAFAVLNTGLLSSEKSKEAALVAPGFLPYAPGCCLRFVRGPADQGRCIRVDPGFYVAVYPGHRIHAWADSRGIRADDVDRSARGGGAK